MRAAATALYRRTETGNPLSAVLAAAAANQVIELWPDCWSAWVLFLRMDTQWNVGVGGLIGLRYESVYPLLDRMELSRREWEQLFEDVRVLEGAALTAMHEK